MLSCTYQVLVHVWGLPSLCPTNACVLAVQSEVKFM